MQYLKLQFQLLLLKNITIDLMKILILEDEIPAYKKLLEHLENYYKEKPKFEWSRTVDQAKQILESDEDFDLIFSDIELLDGTSIDLFQEVKSNCPIIFCTAYNAYILEAFKSNGIAFILKPYTQDDITTALDKYHTLFRKVPNDPIDYTILKDVTTALRQGNTYKSRFIIKNPKGMHLLSIDKISYVEASGTFCKLIDDHGTSHLFSQSISAIYESLNPTQFFKVNRSHIVNINHIVHMENYFKNKLLLQMRGSKEKISTSSSITAKFRIWLDS